MTKEKEEAKKELHNLLNEFRTRFSLVNNKSKEFIEKKDDSDYSWNIPMSTYNQPKISEELKEKIKRLEKICQSIENKKFEFDETESTKSLKIDYKKSLNPSQYFAVSNINGSLLVIAGAGSGKTRTIIYRVSYMLEHDIAPENILLLTFTKKASKEMVDRSITLLNDMRGENIMAGTFHSFSNYVIRKYHKILNIQPNFTIIDTSDSEDIIDLIRQELKFSKKEKAFPKKSRIYTIISKSRNCNLTVESIIDREYKGLKEFVEEIKLIAETYHEYKKGNNIFDYDDLMDFLCQSLKNNALFRERIQEKYKYIMVDEFQDTNVVQREIVDLIASKYKNIMVVGDDSQSIYAFRGADIENILRFPETYPDCKVIKIEQNYRSNQDILSFSNAIVSNAKIGYKKNLFSNNTNVGKPIIKKFYSQEDEAAFIVKNILKLREENIPLKEIAIIYRSSFHANFIQAELLKRNIPYIVYGGLKFTERRHVKDIIAYLRLTFNPMDAIAWNRILKIIPGIGGSSASKIIRQIQDSSGVLETSQFKGKKFLKDLNNLSELIGQVAQEQINIAKKVEMIKDYYTPILKMIEDDYQVRLLDIDVLYSLACNYEKLEKFLSDFALEPPSNNFQNRATPLIDETEESPLTLSTIHSSKGLEWNTVFMPHLLDGLLPSSNSLGNLEDLEEERRLFYVGCTRAKERLFLTMPAHVASWDSFLTHPSRFIIEIDRVKYNLLK
ncbi:MAG: ATP-dependent helicase [Candidatus Sericytochromatia bacterium]|nr:ATP-dependent helicase [Candidatus Sericytochromatia bacterium]